MKLNHVILAAIVLVPASGAAFVVQDGPVLAAPVAGNNGPLLFTWRAERIVCAEGDLPVAAIVPPAPQLGWGGAGGGKADYRFAVDVSGRPVDIRRPDDMRFVPRGDDLAPSLAASRFPGGMAYHDCRVAFAEQPTPIDRAPVNEVMALTVLNTDTMRQPAVMNRVKPDGSTCFRPVLRPLRRDFPDLLRFERAAGRPSWSMVGFDINRAGRPVDVRIAGGTGDAALDTASRKAVARSRFAGGVRKGCLYPYRLPAGAIPAPDMPAGAKARPAGATCPVRIPWSTPPRPNYPNAYRRRAVEGWAVIAFDTAPWGATGNVRVLAAEPSADFGAAAMGAISGAKLPKSDTGYVGCVERIRYVMRDAPGEDESGG